MQTHIPDGWRNGNGLALVLVLMAIVMTSALGVALVMATRTEPMVAANFRSAAQALHAAEAGIERSLEDLFDVANWPALLAGQARSRFVDGPPAGNRSLVDGTVLVLQEVANRANCGRKSACSDVEMDAATATRPWGGNNPRWRLYAYGSLPRLVGSGSVVSPFYIVVMVADDPAENDGQPLEDGGPPASGPGANPGAGILALRGEAFGPRGAHSAVEVTVERTAAGLHLRSWRQVR